MNDLKKNKFNLKTTGIEVLGDIDLKGKSN
jgi:hypothetical protein